MKYTRLIDRYEEYRNIVYGNNRGLGVEFHKYAILESKQYQNIPRAIQHVFLNYKVESDFIKDTIIKSINDDEIPIDLTNYTLHLKNFETELNDIKIWTEKSAKGENKLRKLSGKIIETYSQIRFTEQDFVRLAKELMYRLDGNELQQSKLNTRLLREEEKEEALVQKQLKAQKAFDERKTKISEEKGVLANKLKEAKQKSDEYQRLNIDEMLARVSRKDDLLIERQELSAQKELLESKFNDIKQKYEIQIEQLNNQFEAYKNVQNKKSQDVDAGFFSFKEELSVEYAEALEAIRKQFEERLTQIRSLIDDKKDEASKLENKLFEAKHTNYFQQEISQCKEGIQSCREKLQLATNEIARLDNETNSLKTQWELERQRAEELAENEKKLNLTGIRQLSEQIATIRLRIENSHDSLYGWLNRELPGWEKTIGKVIDEENVLFKADLSPESISPASDKTKAASTNASTRRVKTKSSRIS